MFQGDPVVQGKVDAEAAIAAGRPVRIKYGMPPLDIVDHETGLPYVIYGCEVDDKIVAYSDAYNETIDAARAQGRLTASQPKKR